MQEVLVRLRRLAPQQQRRLAELMDKSNEGALRGAERAELRRLVKQVDAILLANSRALARAARPELFSKRGRPIARRVRQALREPHQAPAGRRARGERV
jgi:hypothetical protein